MDKIMVRGEEKERIFDWTVETPIDEVIGEAIGRASVCWESMEGTGVFDSDTASQITQEVLDIIHRKTIRIK